MTKLLENNNYVLLKVNNIIITLVILYNYPYSY